MGRRRISGIIIFALAATFAFYIHFGKVARYYKNQIAKEKENQRLNVKTIDANSYLQLYSNIGHLVFIIGKAKVIKKEKNTTTISLGKLIVQINGSIEENINGKTLRIRGFLLEKDKKPFMIVTKDDITVLD